MSIEFTAKNIYTGMATMLRFEDVKPLIHSKGSLIFDRKLYYKGWIIERKG